MRVYLHPRFIVLLLLLSISPCLLAQVNDDEIVFDVESTVAIVRIYENQALFRVRSFDDYNPRQGFSRIFDPLFPYLLQIENSTQYDRPDFDRMIVDFTFRLINPTQQKTYYVGSRWLATDNKVVALTHEDHLQIMSIVEDRPNAEPARNINTLMTNIDNFARNMQNRWRDQNVQPYSAHAGWTAENVAKKDIEIAFSADSESGLATSSTTSDLQSTDKRENTITYNNTNSPNSSTKPSDLDISTTSFTSNNNNASSAEPVADYESPLSTNRPQQTETNTNHQTNDKMAIYWVPALLVLGILCLVIFAIRIKLRN